MIINNIKVEYTKDGLNYKQVKNEGMIYMYNIYFENKKIGVEVFKALFRKANDKCSYERYVYPSDKSFGNNAWSFGMYALDKAEAKYQQLIANQNIIYNVQQVA